MDIFMAFSIVIPRIIHQTASSWGTIPAQIKANIDHIRDLNPDFEYRFYSDTEIETFIHQEYGSDLLHAYRRIDPRYGAARADLFRYLCVHHCGGVYLDIKASVSRPLREVFRADDHYLLSQWDQSKYRGWGSARELATIPGGEYQQWHVIAAPNHPFLAAVIKRVLANINAYDPFLNDAGPDAVLRLSGPVAYTLAIHPLLDRYPHRFVDIERDLGIGYTIFQTTAAHYKLFRSHYTRQTQPVVIVSRWKSYLYQVFRILRGGLRRLGLAR
jgi:hypothetical protein